MMNGENLPAVPKGWAWTDFAGVAANIKNAIVDGPFGSNLKTSDYLDGTGGVPVLTTKNLGNGCYTDTCLRYISRKKFEELRRSEVKGGDILVAKIGSCGKAAVYPEGHPSAIIPANLLKMTVHTVMNKKYVFYYLGSRFFLACLEDITTATAQPAFNVTKFRRLPLPLPPLPEQHRIVAKIEELFTRLDAGVEALKKIKVQLKRYRQSVLKAAFEGKLTAQWREVHKGELEPASVLLEKVKAERAKSGKYKELPPLDTPDLPELPQGWVWTSLGDVSFLVTKGSTPTSYGFNYTSSGINFIKVENLRDGIIEKSSLSEFITANIHDFLKRSQLWENDVLFSIAGTIGRVAIVRHDDLPANINQAIALIRCPWQFITPKYIRNVLESTIARSSIEKRPRGIGMNNVSLGDVDNILFPLSPLPEQCKIVEEIERHFSIADQVEKTIEESLKQAERLRRSILKRAFEGKLVPQDPNDEPAEKLLARIKVEKAKRETEKKAPKSKKRVDMRQRRLT